MRLAAGAHRFASEMTDRRFAHAARGVGG
jgi:hypothetical protein